MNPALKETGAAREFSFTHEHFELISERIYKFAGIRLPIAKREMVYARLVRRLRALGIGSFDDYVRFLELEPAEWEHCTNALTTNVTAFFREEHHFGILAEHVRATARPGETFRVWSAGCSTGEEPYSLAMFLLEQSGVLLKGWTFEIQATDLNERSLEHAKAGLYGDYSLRNVSPQYRQKHFVTAGEKLLVGPTARKLVTFSRLNLLEAARMPLLKEMDLIFCANVLIYFDLNSKRKVIEHIHTNLLQHGYFFLGQAESLYGVNDQFKLVHFPSATGYVKCPTAGAGR